MDLRSTQVAGTAVCSPVSVPRGLWKRQMVEPSTGISCSVRGTAEQAHHKEMGECERAHCGVPSRGTNRCRALGRAQGSRGLPEQLKQSSVGGNETSRGAWRALDSVQFVMGSHWRVASLIVTFLTNASVPISFGIKFKCCILVHKVLQSSFCLFI